MFKVSFKKCFYLLFILFILFPSIPLKYSFLEENDITSSIKINVLADSIPDVDLDELTDIPYGELNEMWYDSKIEMLIITPDGNEAFVNACKPLMEWKNEKGVKTIILSNFSQYPGRDDPERIRNMIKSYYEKENIQWVLLAGDAQSDLIPIREVLNNDVGFWGESEKVGGVTDYKPTDYYYADLTGTWDSNGNDIFGESTFKTGGQDEIDWIPEVYVGRLPASDEIELAEMINKTLKYETDPYIENWMGRMLLAGGISDVPGEDGDVDGEDEARLTTYIWQHYTQNEMNFTHLCNYNAAYYTPPGTHSALNQKNFTISINSGYSTVVFAGHGNFDVYTDKIGVGTFRTIYTSTDASASNNIDMPSLIYASACTTSPYDSESHDDSIGETLIKRPNSGAIGYIGSLRVTWYMPNDLNLEIMNRANAKLFWEEFFQNKKYQPGKALYDSKVTYMNSDYFKDERVDAENYDEPERKNLLTYCLLGDPEVDIYTDKPVNASNPFIQDIYEGQLITTIIRDINGKTIPYARVNLKTTDKKYRTIYGDINGKVSFRLPAQANETYNVTITGHNLKSSFFNFTTLADNIKPQFVDEDCTPKDPTVSDNICFDIEVCDSQSGIEKVFLLQS
ncbi:MAG: C25 family cysteine peptidase, partial [Candidatus Odinarchaeota archaeon]